MIIAIDGPAASGKGTLGKRLAHHYGYRHLDTGVIYRAVAYALLSADADLHDEMLAVSAALELDPEKFGNPILKTQKVGEAAVVPLREFSLQGRKREVLRRNWRKARESGAEFEVLSPDQAARHIDELKAVSDQWLRTHAGGSLGSRAGPRIFEELVVCVEADVRRVGRGR